jgi:hypothetical protein
MPAGCALPVNYRDRFDLYSFPYSHFGHTGHGIDWNEVNIAMIKEIRASRAGQSSGPGGLVHSRTARMR